MLRALDEKGHSVWATDAHRGGVYYDLVYPNTQVIFEDGTSKHFRYKRGETRRDPWRLGGTVVHPLDCFKIEDREVVISDELTSEKHLALVYNKTTNTAVEVFDIGKREITTEEVLARTNFYLRNHINVLWIIKAQKDWKTGNLLCIDAKSGMFWWKTPRPFLDKLNRSRYYQDKYGAAVSVALAFNYTEDSDNAYSLHIIDYNNNIRKIDEKYAKEDSMYTLIGLRQNLPYDGYFSMASPQADSFFIRKLGTFKKYYNFKYSGLAEEKASGDASAYCTHFNQKAVMPGDYYTTESGRLVCDGASRKCLYAGGTFVTPSQTRQGTKYIYSYCLRNLFRYVIEPRMQYLYNMTESRKESKDE